MDTPSRIRWTAEEILQQQQQQSQDTAPPPLPILRRRAAVSFTGEEEEDGKQKSPVVVIVVGMAGSGKTTLMSQLHRSLRSPPTVEEKEEKEKDDTEQQENVRDGAKDERSSVQEENSNTNEEEDERRVGYCLNLDPATKLVPFGASIDIRDTVNYKEVMLQHQLGPNGAIMTSLNLFATKFDQVISILEERSFPPPSSLSAPPSLDYILVDTPGQIEAFTWSASGTIMTSALASSFPTVLAFVVDTPRCTNSPSTFMSNMLYACSMMYRTRLPVLIVFNKIDVVSHDVCVEWMTDYMAFQEAMDEYTSDGQSGYYGSLTRSLSMVLDEFYSSLLHVGVSAATGDGVEEFWSKVSLAAREFETGYVEDLKERIEEQEVKKRVVMRESMRRLKRDSKKKANAGETQT